MSAHAWSPSTFAIWWDPVDLVHSQLRLPDAALVQLDLRLFFDGVAEHVVERGKGDLAGPVGR
jgi:hypothetical protein